MGDDLLHRDLVPVRVNSYIDSHRGSIIDPRERLIVSKLNRNDLEDKYLRLFEDYQKLKKLNNTQEDKIKRLSTKLMRVCMTPRLTTCGGGGTFNGDNDIERIRCLTIENAKLKDKINILRNQILSHRVLARPSSQSRRVCYSSALTTYRSDGYKRDVCHNYISEHENNEIQNYITRIKELELQRKRMMSRISELENKLEVYEEGGGVEKYRVAENVEYIRVWRQLKLLNDKFVVTEANNKTLTEENERLRNLVDETTKNHGEMKEKFLAEQELSNELKEHVSRTQNFEVDLRDKEEKIRTLTSELKILQEHRSEIINLSTKSSDAEMENAQLKKQLSDIIADNDDLKTAFDTEQLNIEALQAVNTQLRKKLQDLQNSVDILTFKLNTFEKQSRMNPNKSPTRAEKTEKLNDAVRICACKPNGNDINHNNDNRLKNPHENIAENPKSVEEIHHYSERSIQTDFRLLDWKNDKPKEDKACSTDEEVRNQSQFPSSINLNGKTLRSPLKMNDNSLTPEEMLKLLDDAQISTPSVQCPASKISLEDPNITPCYNPIRRQSSQQSFQSTSQDYPVKIHILDHYQFIDKICGMLKDYWRINYKQKIKISATSSNERLNREDNTSIEQCICEPVKPNNNKSYLTTTYNNQDKIILKCINQQQVSRPSTSSLNNEIQKYCTPDCPLRSPHVTHPAFSESFISKQLYMKSNQSNVVLPCRQLCAECNDLNKLSKPRKTNMSSRHAITIKIDRLRLAQNSPLLQDPDVHQLYVEFSFLGYIGLDLETISVSKAKSHNEDMRFDYMRKFFIDEEFHSKQRSALRDILIGDADSIVHFNIVSEPLREDIDTKDCIEVGCAYLDLRKQILYSNNHSVSLPVMNLNGTDSIGTLKISLYGLEAIRKNLPKFLKIDGLP